MAEYPARGCVLSRINTAESPTTTVIGEVTSFSGFDGAASEIDVTSLADTFKQYLKGVADRGSFSMDVNFDPADVGQVDIRADLAVSASRTFTLVLTDSPATTITFTAFVMSFSIAGGVDDAITGTIGLKITGNWTFS